MFIIIHVYMFIYDSEQLYDHCYKFGWSNHRQSINKLKKYDGAMLRRVHRLHQKIHFHDFLSNLHNLIRISS